MSKPSAIFNGANCRSYSWTQSHSDLEICIKLNQLIKYEHLDVVVTQKSIKVASNLKGEIFIDGIFEQQVATETVYWILDVEDCSVVVYIDKAEDCWWQKLLINEVAAEIGQRHYSIPMEQLDEGSKMSVEKIINEQKQKILNP